MWRTSSSDLPAVTIKALVQGCVESPLQSIHCVKFTLNRLPDEAREAREEVLQNS